MKILLLSTSPESSIKNLKAYYSSTNQEDQGQHEK